MTQTQRAADGIATILHRGQDPRGYRLGLAEAYGVPVADIDRLIAAAGSPCVVDDETAAQMRLAADRRAASQNSRAWRESQHEEV